MQSFTPSDSPLGKESTYSSIYSPTLLFPIPREQSRQFLENNIPLPFHGVDIWTGYEISWLNLKGKPEIAIGNFYFPANSPNLIESKSFKLYLNSLNQTRFKSAEELKNTLKNDLSIAANSPIDIDLLFPEEFKEFKPLFFKGNCLDHLDIEIDTYEINPSFLQVSDKLVEESLYSHLLKSNCPVTGQPDWASLFIHYKGFQINHAGLLKYIISFRNHQGFHEQCVESIFYTILKKCQPTHLTVYARYTRRGGLDINPFRSNFENSPSNFPMTRQ